VTELDLVAAARSGNQEAFRSLVEPHWAGLHAHCYRMLGSPHDAEDALQDSLLRAWRGLPRFQGRSAVRSWLYRITTNVCADAIARRPRRVLPIDFDSPEEVARAGLQDGQPLPDARYEQREAVELAFAAALQHLAPRQRAVIVLREVLGFSAAETAEALEATPTAVNSALQRARKAVEERLPETSRQAPPRSLRDARAREAVKEFADAIERGDVAAIVVASKTCPSFGAQSQLAA
jgi:RNA polymerase sigma-70 factor, ECF subfamily